MTPATANSARSNLHRESVSRQKNGFALLVIFLIAAAVAFTMYQEIPRVAFESARDKEQLLMDRGNQYKRAIQVFYAVNKRYPAELKDLENTNEKRFLRHRYKDPMTGDDEWRLIHTNGSFLTDSLVEKPPTQNAANGLPGQGQTPGEGPLGANNLNSANPAATTAASGNPNDPASAVPIPAPLNAAAQRRPSDRGFSPGPGFTQQPGFTPDNQNAAAPNPFGPNPANFDPNDPRTWPPITLTPANTQPGQPPQAYGQPQPIAPNTGGQPGVYNPLAGAQPVATNPAFPSQGFPIAAQQQTQGIPGQLPGMGGANPQPMVVGNPNPFVPNALAQAPAQNYNQNPAQVTINADGQLTPLANQPVPAPQPPQPFNGGQTSNDGQALNNALPFSSAQAPNLAAGGFNPQAPPPFQNPAGAAAQPTTANAPGAASNNAALAAINNQLYRPTQAPAAGPTGSPGIAGVASKFKGPSIKAYRERTKYQEWEFVYEPITNQPVANQPGQAGALGQNPQQPQNTSGQNGQTSAGSAQPNPFSMPNPFSQPNPFSPPAPTQ